MSKSQHKTPLTLLQPWTVAVQCCIPLILMAVWVCGWATYFQYWYSESSTWHTYMHLYRYVNIEYQTKGGNLRSTEAIYATASHPANQPKHACKYFRFLRGKAAKRTKINYSTGIVRAATAALKRKKKKEICMRHKPYAIWAFFSGFYFSFFFPHPSKFGFIHL